jgi:ribosome-associated translation inhibitor RaiA
MHVTVSTRHVPIDGSLRDRAEEILHRLGRLESGDHRSALDRVELKVRRQLRRVVTRPLAQRHAPVST